MTCATAQASSRAAGCTVALGPFLSLCFFFFFFNFPSPVHSIIVASPFFSILPARPLASLGPCALEAPKRCPHPSRLWTPMEAVTVGPDRCPGPGPVVPASDAGQKGSGLWDVQASRAVRAACVIRRDPRRTLLGPVGWDCEGTFLGRIQGAGEEGVALGLVHARTGSDLRGGASFCLGWGWGEHWVDPRLPSCQRQGVETPAHSARKGLVPRRPGSISGHLRAACAARLTEQGQGSPRWAQAWWEVLGPLTKGGLAGHLDSRCPRPHSGPRGQTWQPPGAALSASLSGAASDVATSVPRSAWPCSLPSFFSVVLVWKVLGAPVPAQ